MWRGEAGGVGGCFSGSSKLSQPSVALFVIMVCCHGCVPHSPFQSAGRVLLWFQMHVFVKRIMGNVPWHQIEHVRFTALSYDAFLGSRSSWQRVADQICCAWFICVGTLCCLFPSLASSLQTQHVWKSPVVYDLYYVPETLGWIQSIHTFGFPVGNNCWGI